MKTYKEEEHMVKHIVMWKVEDHKVHGTKQEILNKMKQALEALTGEIEGLIELEVGFNFNPSEAAYDVVLYSILQDRKALEIYQNHPKHVQVANELIRQVATQRVVVDYDI